MLFRSLRKEIAMARKSLDALRAEVAALKEAVANLWMREDDENDLESIITELAEVREEIEAMSEKGEDPEPSTHGVPSM